MAYAAPPPPTGYVMFPVVLSGAPDSPRGGLTPLMGSPVGTPTGEQRLGADRSDQGRGGEGVW